MPAPSGYASYGGSLALGLGSPPPVIKGMISAEPEGIDYTQIKMGALDDATRLINFANGRGTPPKIKFTYEYRTSPSNNWDAIAALQGTDNVNYVYKLPDGSTVFGVCNVGNLGLPKEPEDDRSTFDVEIQTNSISRG